MKLIKTYLCDDITPSPEELKQAIHISRTEHCFVELQWVFPNSGKYSITIDEEMSYEDVENSLPKIYAI